MKRNYLTYKSIMNILLRNVYVDPPAQYIIIDVGIPMPANITNNILKTIENLLCLGSHRIPAIGVAMINMGFQQVLGLNSTKTDLARILQAIKSVTDLGRYRSNIHMAEFKDCVHLGIKRALEEFTALPSKIGPEDHSPSKIQILILSMKNGLEIRKTAEQVISAIKTSAEIIKKILVMEVLEDHLNTAVGSNPESLSPIIKYRKVVGSPEKLDAMLKTCLLRYDTDREHLQLVVKELVILCDIQECLISRILPVDGDVCRLEVVDRVPAEEVHDTSTTGQTVVIQPSRAPQICATRRVHNNQYFSALSDNLEKLEQYLVGLLKTEGQPDMYFVIMPVEGLMMLRSLVTSELALPIFRFDHREMIITAEIDSYVRNTLFRVPTIPKCNPTMFMTNLRQHALQRVQLQAEREQMAMDDAQNQPMFVSLDIKRTIKIKKPSRRKASKRKQEHSRELPRFSGPDEQHLSNLICQRNPFFKF